MTLFFPDLNVWLALSDGAHSHNVNAWNWWRRLPADSTLIFSRYTHMGLLRLLTNPAVMSNQALTLRKAWNLYDAWLADPRVEFYLEPRDADRTYRTISAALTAKPATKWVGDCWLLAFAASAQASLVTFDLALHQFARAQGYSAVIPS